MTVISGFYDQWKMEFVILYIQTGMDRATGSLHGLLPVL